MGKATLFGIIMFYLCISMFLYVGGVRVVQNDAQEFLGTFIDVDKYSTNNQLVATEGFESSIPTQYQESGSGGLLSFIDVLGSIKSFLIFIVNILFSPLGLFIGSGIPSTVALFIGVPLFISGVLAFIYFVRSGN